MELFNREEKDLKADNELVRSQEHIKIARLRFRQLGIATFDASVFKFDDLDRFKFIDIELDEHRLESCRKISDHPESRPGVQS